MALTTTTLSSAVAVTDNSIKVASATGFAAGNLVLIDQEVMIVTQTYVAGGTTVTVKRGQNGSVTAAHNSSANVTTMLASDEVSQAGTTSIQWPVVRGRQVYSISANGAIPLPPPGSDGVAIINGTSALTTLTLAEPTKDMDGTIMYIVANGKAAHVVTLPSGLGNGGTALDVLTFASGGQNVLALIAANGFWCAIPSVLAGTLTNITVTAS